MEVLSYHTFQQNKDVVGGFAKEKTDAGFTPFYYKDFLVDEQSPRVSLLHLARELGMEESRYKTNKRLCADLTQLLKLQNRFYNPDYVLSINGQPFEFTPDQDLVQKGKRRGSEWNIREEKESELSSAPDDASTNGSLSSSFMFPSPSPSLGFSSKNDEKQRKAQVEAWSAYIQQLKEVLYQAPEIQIAGDYDPTHAKPLNIKPGSIEDMLWTTCETSEDDAIWDDRNKRKERHQGTSIQIKLRFPRLSRFANMEPNQKWTRLVELMARSSKQDYLELEDLLYSLRADNFNLNRLVSKEDLKATGARCANYDGATLLQIPLLCGNLWREGIDPYLMMRALVCASTTHGLPEIDLNLQDRQKKDTVLNTAMKRCSSIRNEIKAIRETLADSSQIPPEAKISEQLLNKRITLAYQTLHDIIYLLLRPGEDCGGEEGKSFGYNEDDFLPINPNRENKLGESALYIAVRSGCLLCTKMLNKHASNLDASIREYNTGKSALLEAVSQDNPLVLFYVLLNSKNLWQRDRFGSTIFHLAARNGFDTCYKRHANQKSVVKKLWDESHKPKTTASTGSPAELPPYTTVKNSAPTITEMLWYSLRDSLQGMKLKTTEEKRIEDTVRSATTFSPGSREDIEQKTRAQQNVTRMIQALIDATDQNGLTALMIAVLRRDESMVWFLILVCNADPLIRNSTTKLTALQMLINDLKSEIFPDMKKKRAKIQNLLQAAEESALRKAKGKRFETYGVTATTAPSGKGLKEVNDALTTNYKGLIPYAELLSELKTAWDSSIAEINKMANVELKKNVINKYYRTFFPHHVCVLGIASEDRKKHVSKRYEAAAQFGLTEFETLLYSVEEQIRKTTSLELLHDVAYELCDFLRQIVMIPSLKAELVNSHILV